MMNYFNQIKLDLEDEKMIEYKELLRSEERAKKGREILNKILPELREKYPPDYYVYIEVDSMEAYHRVALPNSVD